MLGNVGMQPAALAELQQLLHLLRVAVAEHQVGERELHQRRLRLLQRSHQLIADGWRADTRPDRVDGSRAHRVHTIVHRTLQ